MSPQTPRLVLTVMGLACCPLAPVQAMGPAAPFTPPRATSPAALAPPIAPNRPTAPTAAHAAQSALPSGQPLISPQESALPADALQGVRTGSQPVALLEGRWWGLGQGPGGRRITAIDSRGIWIHGGPQAEQPNTPGRQQRLWLWPNATTPGPATTTPATTAAPTPVLSASAHGAKP